MTTIEQQMRKAFFDHFFNGEEVEILEKTPKNKEELSTHLQGRVGILQTYNGASPCIVTACGWVNPPEDRMAPDASESTCSICLESLSKAW
jgi:hypothetical protein